MVTRGVRKESLTNEKLQVLPVLKTIGKLDGHENKKQLVNRQGH
jgi:hypothetical protein